MALPDNYTLDGGGNLLTNVTEIRRPRHALLPRRDDLHAPNARRQCHCHNDRHRDQEALITTRRTHRLTA
ncbi:MAG: hypothetical protein IJG24_03445 [Selenomonadaceae bacterium]|nr:hypothetical protein [Selenomonadaceae bacterium]